MKGAIFDLDGTLLDSMHIWEHAAQEFLQKHNLTVPPDIVSQLNRMTLLQSAEYFISTFGIVKTTMEILTDFSSIVADAYQHEVLLKSGAREYLESLCAQKIPLCVVTANERIHATNALTRLEVLHCFDFILTCTETKLSKTQPDIFLMAAKQLRLSPTDIYVFEDSYHAMQTAKAVGFKVVAVEDKSAISDVLNIQKLCDHYIHSFDEMRK